MWERKFSLLRADFYDRESLPDFFPPTRLLHPMRVGTANFFTVRIPLGRVLIWSSVFFPVKITLDFAVAPTKYLP
ncbi:hypothetical protein CH380_01075 [Leptospira adleri]|uniref:Uncharacterized protein n=1 Tax=Leptospira adleri TaxID=2023186 RepID=A0A2M9YUG4_9LEPT|nr:hypothetical protein CH380_01075 [Leptospira adleri]